MNSLDVEVGILKNELNTIRNELKDLRESQKDLLEFMYKVEGGKTWLFGLLVIAGSLGGLLTNVLGNIFKH